MYLFKTILLSTYRLCIIREYAKGKSEFVILFQIFQHLSHMVGLFGTKSCQFNVTSNLFY